MGNVNVVNEAIEHIEHHLIEPMSLDTVAQAVNYSKYHLHRVFAAATGITLHSYIKRRKLTNAAGELTGTSQPIIDIAYQAGYENQQAFTTVFKEMYKQTPNHFRRLGKYYPLQLNCRYEEQQPSTEFTASQKGRQAAPATLDDIPGWMRLVRLVVSGYPFLDEVQYIRDLTSFIQRHCAYVIKDQEVIVGIMLLDPDADTIDFLGDILYRPYHPGDR